MKTKGFTLLELMIAVAIIGILAAIAWPRYQQYVIETNRTDGKRELLQVAQELERCYTISNTYTGCGLGLPRLSDDQFYNIQVTDPGSTTNPPPSALSDTTYTLYAVPRGIQVQDTECGSLTLNQAGVRGESGSSTPQDCW